MRSGSLQKDADRGVYARVSGYVDLKNDHETDLIRSHEILVEVDEGDLDEKLTPFSDAGIEDLAVDELGVHGWLDGSRESCGKLRHEMNGVLLPGDEPTNFGDVSVIKSNNVHLGNRTFYKGPVTIKQFVCSANPASGVNNEIELPDSSSGYSVEKSNFLEGSQELAHGSMQKFFDGAKAQEWYRSRRCAVSIGATAATLGFITVLFLWMSRRSDPTISDVCLVTRAEWGAQPPNATYRIKQLEVQPVPYVIISHAFTTVCYSQAECVLNVRMLQTLHIESKGWNDIAYNFLVGGDGLVYEGRGWDVEGAHTSNYNHKSIGITFIGTFNNVEPTKAQIYAAKQFIGLGLKMGKIAKNYKLLGLRQCVLTESPGEVLYNIIKTWEHWSPMP